MHFNLESSKVRCQCEVQVAWDRRLGTLATSRVVEEHVYFSFIFLTHMSLTKFSRTHI